MTDTQTATATAPPSPAQTDRPEDPTVRSFLRNFVRADSATGVGFLQVVVGLAAIWTIFGLLNPNFLSATNLTNLSLQIVAVAALGMGVVLVLLLGEIDLSIGSVSGLGATALAALNVKLGVPPLLAIGAALLGGALIGLIQGLIVAGFGVPSFVVTLGGLIGWQGLQLFIFDFTGAMNVSDPVLLGLTNTFFPPWVGWLLLLAALGIRAVFVLRVRRRRAKAGLVNVKPWVEVVRFAISAAVPAAVIVMFVQDRGIPLAVLIVVGLVLLMDFIARRTLFGRRIYAVGGDAQAAGRVGIDVRRITVYVFMLSGTFAALGGVLSASRLQSVTQGAGSGGILLDAIAAVVIGGTSLFGGRGSLWSALLGALVIGSISNGMDLLALASPVKLMITGAVLITAVIFDASVRRKQAR
ncbi:MAG: Inner-rane translocator [Blastococcus sp.]|nr:Inner-rane translocator [Blastococcus sp.]